MLQLELDLQHLDLLTILGYQEPPKIMLIQILRKRIKKVFTCLIVIAGFQPFSSSNILRQTVPLTYY